MWVSLAFFAVVVIAVVAFRLGQMSARQSYSRPVGSDGEITRVAINGREYADPEEMPSEARGAYDFAIDTMIDRNHDGKIDVLGASDLSQTDFERREVARRTFQQLKQLEKLKTDGMITNAEYSAKRTELLKES
jgi:hypothetical protein